MIIKAPKVHGHSFGGIYRYLLDKERELYEAFEGEKPPSELNGEVNGVMGYLLDSDRSVAAQVIGGNTTGTSAEIGQQMAETSARRPDVKRPVFHAIMAWEETENPNSHDMNEAANMYLEAIKFDRNEHQYAVVLHRDSGNPHIHIVANRVSDSGELFYGSHSGKIANKVRPLIAQQFEGWTDAGKEIETSNKSNEIKLPKMPSEKSRDLMGMANRTFESIAKDDVHQAVKSTISKSDGSISSFLEIAEEEKLISPVLYHNKSGELTGLSFGLLQGDGSENPRLNNSGKPWNFTGSQVGWKARAFNQAMNKRRLEVESGAGPKPRLSSKPVATPGSFPIFGPKASRKYRWKKDRYGRNFRRSKISWNQLRSVAKTVDSVNRTSNIKKMVQANKRTARKFEKNRGRGR